jgi:ADP-ribose pyrophosphatase YjhB (NUDIX family)
MQHSLSSSPVIHLPTTALLIVRDRKLLLAFSKNKNCFYLPGGKITAGESPVTALCREIKEELSVQLHEEDLVYYTHISAPAFGEIEGTIMEQECYLVNKEVAPIASAEVGEIRFFSIADYNRELNQAPGAKMILEQLNQDGYVD